MVQSFQLGAHWLGQLGPLAVGSLRRLAGAGVPGQGLRNRNSDCQVAARLGALYQFLECKQLKSSRNIGTESRP